MFILGIKAPGISSVRDYYSRYSDAEVRILIQKMDYPLIWQGFTLTQYTVTIRHGQNKRNNII